MERDSSVFVPEINCLCWEYREAESCVLEMKSLATPARLGFYLCCLKSILHFFFHFPHVSHPKSLFDRDSPLEAEEH